MTEMPILIAGAGMASMAFARALSARNVPYRLFEAAAELKTSSLAMTLDSGAPALASLLGIDHTELRSLTAVDAPLGGHGRYGRTVYAETGQPIARPASLEPSSTAFRANNERMRRCMAEGLDIEFGRKLTGWTRDPHGQGVLATLERQDDGADEPRVEKIRGSLIVCADGVHSATRARLLPQSQLRIEPYAVFYGAFRLQAATFADVFSSIGEDNVIYGLVSGSTMLSLSIDDRNSDTVKLSWTYSRPAHDPPASDPLFRPKRALSDAKAIPDAFYAELSQLPPLVAPFDRVFVTPAAKASIRYNWLMRSTKLNVGSELADAVEEEGVVLLGDAAHATPIVGGDGANQAVLDGIALDAQLAARPDQPRIAARRFVETEHARWAETNEASVARLEALHSLATNDTSKDARS